MQLTIGLSNADFKTKWGNHYTRSLLCAHRLQQCHNYKVGDASNSDAPTALKSFVPGPFGSILRRAPVQVPRLPRHNILYSDCFCLLRNRRSIVDAADTAFCTLPAPQGRVLPPRSQPVYSSSSSSSYSAPSAAAPPPAVDMSRFMDRYGGCFAPQVKMMMAVLVVV